MIFENIKISYGSIIKNWLESNKVKKKKNNIKKIILIIDIYYLYMKNIYKKVN